jgi:hypothetical protein
MRIASISLALAFTSVTLISAMSGELPKSAKPMPADSLRTAYSGKTLTVPQAQIFFSPDGSAIAYSHTHNTIADGSWDVSDGRVCSHMTWKGTGAPISANNCDNYMVDQNRIFHKFTSDQFGSDPSWSIEGSALNKLKPGDAVRAKFETLKAKLGKGS